VRVLAPNPSPLTGAGTNTYVVTSRIGPCVVIDPGPDDEEHVSTLARIAARNGGACAILVTHDHPDHSAGAARLRTRTGAPILVSERSDAAFADGLLADGADVAFGERRLHAIYTPGHRFDHLCFLLGDARTLFGGDLVAGSGTVLIAPPEGDLGAYLASLRRLLALDLARILPGHGPAVDRPRELLTQYIAHRGERETQVLAALARGPQSVDAIVTSVYGDLDPALRRAAALTALSHLLKLEGEGRAQCEGGDGTQTWRLVPPGHSF
jgi:glyoxylase-like metal-dependent hydrolase (beta-lactamase superfamily II)